MHPLLNAGRRAAALFAAILVFCFLPARAEEMTIYTVTSLNNSGPGTLRQAILDADASTGDFKIVIAVEETPVITSGMPTLEIHDRSGWIQGNPNVTLTDLLCDIRDGGILTLEDTIIDNSKLGPTTITVNGFNPDNALILKGHNRIIGGTVIPSAPIIRFLFQSPCPHGARRGRLRGGACGQGFQSLRPHGARLHPSAAAGAMW